MAQDKFKRKLATFFCNNANTARCPTNNCRCAIGFLIISEIGPGYDLIFSSRRIRSALSCQRKENLMNYIISHLGNMLIGLQPKRVFFQKLFLILLLLCSWQIAEAAPALSRSPVAGPPTVKVKVSGSGFSAYEAVDVYFDTEDLCLSATNGLGRFTCTLQVPKEALPGSHWLSAVGRMSGLAAQKPFIVRVNWSQFHYGPRNRGYNPYENVLSSANVADLTEAWIYTTGSGIVSSPAVANGVVYVGSGDYNLYALDAITGVKKWSYPTGGFIYYSSPAVANGVVYVGSMDNNLYALDAMTGVKKWSYPTGGYIYSSPAVANGVVYVGSRDNNLYALDAMTGAKKWSYTTGGSIYYSSPAVANGVVYVGSDDNNLYALDAMTGVKKWSYPTGARIYSSPAVANGVVYVGSDDKNLYALDAMTGVKKWSYPTGGYIYSSPAVANGVVYVGSDDNNLYALDALTGVKKWSYPTGGYIYSSSPAVANGMVYVGSLDNNLYALSTYGSLRWSYPTGGDIYSSPAVANGMVYVGSYDKNLYCFSLDPGGVFINEIPIPDPALLIPDHSLELQDGG
jgi:outer membrane protein assembly factor BamB